MSVCEFFDLAFFVWIDFLEFFFQCLAKMAKRGRIRRKWQIGKYGLDRGVSRAILVRRKKIAVAFFGEPECWKFFVELSLVELPYPSGFGGKHKVRRKKPTWYEFAEHREAQPSRK